MTEAEKAKEGRSRSSGVACKTPYAHFASLYYAAGVVIVSVAILTRMHESFDFIVTVVEESAGEVVESFATDIQWFSKTIIQMLLVGAVYLCLRYTGYRLILLQFTRQTTRARN